MGIILGMVQEGLSNFFLREPIGISPTGGMINNE